MLIYRLQISFASPVHIRRIMVIGAGADTDAHPAGMKAFVNMEDLDFSGAADMEPVGKGRGGGALLGPWLVTPWVPLCARMHAALSSSNGCWPLMC